MRGCTIADEVKGIKAELRKRKISHRADVAANEEDGDGDDDDDDDDVRSGVA